MIKIKKITNKDFKFYEGDCCDKETLCKIFNENKIDAVVHFAGYKAVGESVKLPLMYYSNNLISSINLLEVMKEKNVKNEVKAIGDELREDITKYTSSALPMIIEVPDKSGSHKRETDPMNELIKRVIGVEMVK